MNLEMRYFRKILLLGLLVLIVPRADASDEDAAFLMNVVKKSAVPSASVTKHIGSSFELVPSSLSTVNNISNWAYIGYKSGYIHHKVGNDKLGRLRTDVEVMKPMEEYRNKPEADLDTWALGRIKDVRSFIRDDDTIVKENIGDDCGDGKTYSVDVLDKVKGKPHDRRTRVYAVKNGVFISVSSAAVYDLQYDSTEAAKVNEILQLSKYVALETCRSIADEISIEPGSATQVIRETPFDWYDTFQESIPKPQLVAVQSRDSDVFKRLRIPSILAILKFELAEGNWPNLDRKTRRQLLAIIQDRNLTIAFTGKQSVLTHSAGAQTIGENKVLINAEGFFKAGAKKSPYELAKLILHEMGHVHYLRDQWLPYYLKLESIEDFPNLVESQLSREFFTDEMVLKVQGYIKGIN